MRTLDRYMPLENLQCNLACTLREWERELENFVSVRGIGKGEKKKYGRMERVLG